MIVKGGRDGLVGSVNEYSMMFQTLFRPSNAFCATIAALVDYVQGWLYLLMLLKRKYPKIQKQVAQYPISEREIALHQLSHHISIVLTSRSAEP